MSDETIKIITSNFEATAEPVSGQKSILAAGMYYFGDEDEDTEETPEESPQSGNLNIQDLSTNKLEQELTKFMQTVDRMFSKADLQANMETMELAEVELWVAITAEGSISLLGVGSKLAGTRSVCMRFRKKS